MSERPADIVILDLMLPGIDGLEVCRRLRRRRGADHHAHRSRQRGRPDHGARARCRRLRRQAVQPAELVLRVDSVLKRTGHSGEGGVVSDGSLVVDADRRVATDAGAELSLTTREFDLLRYLIAHPGKAFTREDLLEHVWGWTIGDRSTVTVHVRRLREKIESDPTRPERLVTVWGVGYRWEPVEVGA